jgi:hypothetical protein
MNTNNEDSRTIGHLDPLRPPFGAIRPASYAATSYGTTHEFIINQNPGHGTGYQDAADPYHSECAIADHWLWNARLREADGNGNSWDSGYSSGTSAPGDPPNLTPVRPRATVREGHVESQFRHGYLHSGMQPITRANDPFWNVRAFDTAMKRHDGYVSYPLMCAIHQLVLDDIAAPVVAPAVSAGH